MALPLPLQSVQTTVAAPTLLLTTRLRSRLEWAQPQQTPLLVVLVLVLVLVLVATDLRKGIHRHQTLQPAQRQQLKRQQARPPCLPLMPLMRRCHHHHHRHPSTQGHVPQHLRL